MIAVLTHHWAKSHLVDEARAKLDGNGLAQSKAPDSSAGRPSSRSTTPHRLAASSCGKPTRYTTTGRPAPSGPRPWRARTSSGPSLRSPSGSRSSADTAAPGLWIPAQGRSHYGLVKAAQGMKTATAAHGKGTGRVSNPPLRHLVKAAQGDENGDCGPRQGDRAGFKPAPTAPCEGRTRG